MTLLDMLLDLVLLQLMIIIYSGDVDCHFVIKMFKACLLLDKPFFIGFREQSCLKTEQLFFYKG
ncbi:hypothetical protein SAMN04488018_101237 [Myroides marinus]|uniref:Uncharacterized protein n=1 Tax=Myroides marinus TaxID=703342 RepID=A0A1H6R497_9FLAO|nr:hypothetical protein SAMN04488018_101237 [Myroides marinus]